MENVNILELIESKYDELYEQEKKVADYVLENPTIITSMSVKELSDRSGASQATIVRFSKKLGCKGFYHLKIALSKSIESDRELSDLTIDTDDYSTSIKNIFISKVDEIEKCVNSLDHKSVERSMKLIKKCENLYIYGAGNTNSIAVYASYQFNQYGVKAIVNVGPEMQINAAFGMTEKDACILISNSGMSNLILDIATIAQQNSVPIIAMTSYPTSPLAMMSEETITSFTYEQEVFEVSSSSRITQMALIDMMILLLSNENGSDHKKYNQEREEFLAKYKQ